MIVDARSLSDGTSLNADICIAGAGAAGITIARDLVDSGLSVIVLESGGFETDPAIQDLYRGEMTGIQTWHPHQNRVRVFGGTTHHWGGWCRPLDPADLEPKTGHRTWPITWNDLVPWYQRAQETLELGPFDYDARSLASRLGQPILVPDSEIVEPRMYQFSPPTRFGKKYRQDLESASNITVYLHANLRSIRLAAGNQSISHLDCRTLEGTSFTVEADRYVLALGGLENARVLLASNEESASGVSNGSNNVGRFFMEHPHYYDSAAVVSTNLPDVSFYTKQPVTWSIDGTERTVPTMGAIGLTGEARKELGVGNFTITLEERFFDGFDPGEDYLPASTARSVLGSPEKEPRLVVLTCRSEQTAIEESRVGLSEELDPIGMPRIDLKWVVDEKDTRRLTEALEIIGAELARYGMGRLWSRQRDRVLSAWTGPGAHHLGTTAMSEKAEDGVVDANLRSHEVDNLYIAGSSVFPTGGDSNPTLTIVALAHRLAAHLRE